MAFPTAIINNSTGSNTQASGAGNINVFGSNATVTNGSGSVTITDSVPTLGTVAVDGSALLWVSTASGRQFSKITGVSGSSGSWTLTVEDTVWTAGSGKTWAIGGQRYDFETTNSGTKNLFGDLKPGATIDIQQTGTNYALTSTVNVTMLGSAAGRITVKSSSGTRPIITSATNSVALFTFNNSGLIVWDNLKFTHTAATRGDGFTGITNGSGNLYVRNCIFDGLAIAIHGGFSNPNVIYGWNCAFINTTGAAAVVTANASIPNSFYESCYFGSNAGDAIQCSNNGTLIVIGCVFALNSFGIRHTSTGSLNSVHAYNCSFYGQTNDGIRMVSNSSGTQMALGNCIFYGNGGYGLNCQYTTQADTDSRTIWNFNNAYGSNSLGNYQNIAAGVNEIALSGNPFVGAGSANFSLNSTVGAGASCRDAGWPGAMNGLNATGYLDVGALQHQDSGSSSLIAVLDNSGGMA